MSRSTPTRLTGTALVTGASRGIGYALAAELARRGQDLVVVADTPDLDDAARRLEAHGGRVEAVRADLARPEGVDAVVRALEGRDLRVAALNAGVAVHGPFASTPLEDQLRLVRLNAESVVHLSHRLVPVLAATPRGGLLLTGSVAGMMPGPLMSTYAASKAFVRSFAAALRNELRGTPVTVTCVLPGPTDTDFFTEAEMEGTVVGKGPKVDPETVARRAVDALLRGEAEVAVGAQAKAMVVSARLLPEGARAAVHRVYYSLGKPKGDATGRHR